MTSTIKNENGKTRTRLNWILYLVAFLNAELVTVFVNESWGLVFYFVVLLGLLLHSALEDESVPQKFLLASTLIPIIRIVHLAMPLEEFSEAYRLLIMSIPILIGMIGVIRSLGLNPTEVGLISGSLAVQGLIAITGVGFGLVAYFILDPEPIISDLTLGRAIMPALALLFIGFVEELAFRGVMQRAAQQIGIWGWVNVALVF